MICNLQVSFAWFNIFSTGTCIDVFWWYVPFLWVPKPPFLAVSCSHRVSIKKTLRGSQYLIGTVIAESGWLGTYCIILIHIVLCFSSMTPVSLTWPPFATGACPASKALKSSSSSRDSWSRVRRSEKKLERHKWLNGQMAMGSRDLKHDGFSLSIISKYSN